MSSPKGPRNSWAGTWRKGEKEDARSIHDIPDDLLWLILLHLDSPHWLLRAACACKRWRRSITGADEGRAFLGLASSLHPPTVVGQYYNDTHGDHRFVPSSSHMEGSRRFSVDFLVEEKSRWYVADCHGGLVLLHMSCASSARSLPRFIVYDPLTRQHRQIYPVHPNNHCGLPLGIVREAFDSTNLVFSKVDLPIRLIYKLKNPDLFPSISAFTVVHGAGLGPTSPARTSIVHVHGEVLQLFRQDHGGGKWVLERSIAYLSEATRGLSVCLENCSREMQWRSVVDVVTDDGAAFAVLSAYSRRGDSDYCKSWFFSIDLNTMELRVLPEEPYRHDTSSIFNYMLPWPQFLQTCT